MAIKRVGILAGLAIGGLVHLPVRAAEPVRAPAPAAAAPAGGGAAGGAAGAPAGVVVLAPGQKVFRLLVNSEAGMRSSARPAAGGEIRTGHLTVGPPEGGGPASKLLVTEELRQQLPNLTAERGDLITLTMKAGSRGDGTEMVAAAVPFAGPKALGRRHVYQFAGVSEQRVGVQTFSAVRLAKFGEIRDGLIPTRASFNGAKPQPDPAIADLAKLLAAGDLVEADFYDGPAKGTFFIADLAPAKEPVVGDFVKLATLKDPSGKVVPGLILDVDGEQRSFALPAAAPGMRPPAVAAVQAAVALSKKLKPGYAVRAVCRDPAAAGGFAVIRELQLDGEMEPTTDRAFALASTYVTVTFMPQSTGTVVVNPASSVYVSYRPGSSRAEDKYLEIGVARVLDYKEMAAELKLTTDQLNALRGARAKASTLSNVYPPVPERTQWATAFNAYTGAKDEASRARVEHEMVTAAHELGARWRADIKDYYSTIRVALSPDQVRGLIALGQKKLMFKFD